MRRQELQIFSNDIFRVFALTLILFCITSQSQAQNNFGTHFFKQQMQATYSNPAFIPDIKYGIGLPLISSAGISFSNKGFVYRDVISEKPGTDSMQLDLSKALRKMNTRSYLSFDASADLFSAAIRRGTMYVGFNVTEKAFCRAALPRDLIELIWNGNASAAGRSTDYTANINMSSYREYGLLLAQKRGRASYGFRFKYLVGNMNIKSERDTFVRLYTDSNAFSTIGRMNLLLRTSGLREPLARESGLFDKENPGVGFDAGMNYSMFNDRLNLSFSMIDIGSINWNHRLVTYSSSNPLHSTGTNLNKNSPGDSSTFAQVTDSVQKFYQIQTSKVEYSSHLIPKYFLSATLRTSERSTWGFLTYLEYFNQVYPSFTLYYGRKINENLELNATYSVINSTFSNVGIGAQYKLGPLHLYFSTDNIVSVLRAPLTRLQFSKYSSVYLPPLSQVYSIRMGLNLQLDFEHAANRPSLQN